MTATASQGLALMHEMLYIASSLRLPIVMGVANRALSAPINIHGDHSDMMGSRDCGWIQIYAENAQEAYDWTLQAFKIGEDENVLLPVTVNLDGFILSHSMEDVDVFLDDEARKFLPPRRAKPVIDPEKPSTVGALALPDYYFEFKKQQDEAMKQVPQALLDVTKEYQKMTGRGYGILHSYRMKDAETAIISLGSTSGTVRTVTEDLRKKGLKVGAIKLWLYRPFPVKELLKALGKVKSVVVLDRALSFGAQYGALCEDVVAALYAANAKTKVLNAIYGLGGRDITPSDIESLFKQGLTVAKTGKIQEAVKFVGVRE
jgi:pyruvate ferredoxin oxidoreductase alpha subunit